MVFFCFMPCIWREKNDHIFVGCERTVVELKGTAAYNCVHVSSFHDFFDLFSFFGLVFLFYIFFVHGCALLLFNEF
jgi:hypothetical protein